MPTMNTVISFDKDYVNSGYGKFYEATLSASNEESEFSKILAGSVSIDDVKDFVKRRL